MDLGLQGKVALVTGSWRGTGAGIAEVLGREGCRVLVHGLEKGQPDEVVERPPWRMKRWPWRDRSTS